MSKNMINYVISLLYLSELYGKKLISEEEYYMLKRNLNLKYAI